ncbi:MAG: adenosine deaminase, partial [Magnetovibrio sp.]|nr:adenosine deaminase [Magnetovibrio sp.]
MTRNATNTLLHKAKKSKNDEFYTQLCDIDSELKHYCNHFKNKTVYCNCDDWEKSNFITFFQKNFQKLGLKKLISTCYIENGQGKLFEYDGVNTKTKVMNDDGDFRSAESIHLLSESDIVITNPPFSLFREYVSQLVTYNKKFLCIGNVNAITYKEIFKLIKNNSAWLGINLGRGVSGFIVPDHYELYGTETRIDNQGQRIVSPNNCLWLTNLEHFKRNEYLDLTKSYIGNESNYPVYDNYNGINVNKTKDIPYDYDGAIGVPITFIHKYMKLIN